MTDQETVDLLHALNRYLDESEQNSELLTVFDMYCDLIDSLPEAIREQWVAS